MARRKTVSVTERALIRTAAHPARADLTTNTSCEMTDLISIRHAISLIALIVVVAAPASAGWHVETSTVHYDVSYPDIEHNEARITATFSGLEDDKPLELRMSRTSPGRYSLHEFAKNVYDVEAVDGAGQPVETTRVDPFSWTVSGHDGTVSVSYTLFADQADGTYSGFDRTHAHMNMPATFMWARELEYAPVSITFRAPDPEWTIATQLFPTDDPNTFTAPDLHYFMDSPTEIADLEWFRWRPGDGSGQEMRIALHHEGSRETAEAFAESVRKIVDAQIAVFGEPPAYDGGTYTFIVDFLPHVFGDGMEHRNSTIVTGTDPLTSDGLSNLGTISHEFFHQWNVERIRPADLEPFDFFGPNPTEVLWFAEGFTSYYTDLAIRRAGLMSVGEYAESLGGTIDAVLNSPGRRHRSPVEMSRMATLTDRAAFWDRTNYDNTFISYYTWGSAVALALDLTLRAEYDTDLDAYMRLLWDRFGKDEQPYVMDDLQTVLADLSGDESFADDFFERFVHGRQVPDFGSLLAEAGVVLRPERPDALVFGGELEASDDGIIVAGAPLEGTPLHEAGLALGDVITAVDGNRVSDPDYLEALLDRAAAGESFVFTVDSRGVQVDLRVIPVPDPAVETLLFEDAGREPDAEAERFRSDWLGF